MRVAHVKAICRNPPIHGVAGNMNNLQILGRTIYKHVMFSRKYKEKLFFVSTKF